MSKISGKEGDEEVQVNVVSVNSGVDVAASMIAGYAEDPQLTERESRRLRNKLDRRILPLLFILYFLQYLDKASIGAAAVLGIVQDTGLTTNEFNNLGSVFYVGLLIAQWPQAWALNRLPVAKWLTFNIFLWAILLGLHPICKNYGGLVTLRLFLGMVEAPITPGLMIIVGMFYRRTEIGERIGWTFQCNGFATMASGFLAFGAAHLDPKEHPNQWQWFMIIIALLTLVVGILFWTFFPDNPTTAKFLTKEEKIFVVNRVRSNQAGIETKKWKHKQFIEALTDAKTWLFFFLTAIIDLQNGIGIEYSFVLKAMGFSQLQTALLNIPSGGAQIAGITLACYLLRKFPNSRSVIAVLFFIPSILGALLVMILPFQNKAGLLSGIYVLGFGGSPSFVMIITWVASTSAGHTKRVTTNGVFFIGYALGQLLCTQFWKSQYAPRYRVPWGINLGTYVVGISLILVVRYVLSSENKRRDKVAEQQQVTHEEKASGHGSSIEDRDAQEEFGWLETADEEGRTVKVKVHKALLDLTDRENLAFRYVL